MSETTDIPEDEIFAGEYVLGVLSDDERTLAEARMENDASFASFVWQWTDYLAPLAAGIAPVAPSPAVRDRVMASVFAKQQVETGSFWSSLAFWRGASVALGLLAALFLTLFATTPRQQPVTTEAPLLFASLTPPSVEGILSVKVDPATNLATINVQDLTVDDLYTELWVIPADGTPRSLGVFPAEGGQITLPQRVLEFLEAGVILAVSLEELPTGSSTGAPSERVIAIGQIREY